MSTNTSPTRPVRCRGFALGMWETNCFVLWVEGSPACWIVDAGFEPDPLVEFARREGLSPEALVLTHAHVDHIAGVSAVRAAFPGLPVWIHGAEAAWLASPMLNLSEAAGVPLTAPGPDATLEHGQELDLAGSRWRVLHTPGHSPGGVALYCEGGALLLGGDALFAGSVGRTDLPGGDFETLAASIRTRLYTLPDETRVLPGHGPPTTIGREKRANPFVKG
ncbi:MAG TPA: MBL fold metallo-hydrolase [Phycisphaerales bacterium]|nr:MBL fold metallo-hydrolase [Phycisphaerales bacterium]